ncbi:VOC family protein [Sphingorhabdus sp. Alg239-R122]|uniref:VOC family protein n=1 Tax=Sphingorhabdus sp. Alg239-R122 TaxID=2305989 RepID=UPI0013D982ED|nr:VOC family protein [Sphingorhabdus sp. Alg239-R122]
MPNKHGDFIWYELTTGDMEAAQDFYGELLGWTVADSGNPEMEYRIFSKGEAQIAGMMALTEEMEAGGGRPAWLGYIEVDDVEASAGRIKASGGAVHMEPVDIPDVGRFTMVNDPQGAFFYIMHDSSGEESQSYAKTEPKVGHCAWNELVTSDPEGAISFYTEQFGWEKTDEMDMGPMGTYHLLGHGYGLGGVMQKPDEMPVSAWAYYFRVADIDAAVKTINAKGGQVFMGPQEIPDGNFVLNGIDPQGAVFALIGARG